MICMLKSQLFSNHNVYQNIGLQPSRGHSLLFFYISFMLHISGDKKYALFSRNRCACLRSKIMQIDRL